MADIEDDVEDLQGLDVFIEPESLEMAVEFSKRYTRLLLNRKSNNEDVKTLRKEYNELGLPTSVVIKAFSELRKEKKEEHKDEIKAFKHYISKNTELMDLLTELEAKSTS